MGDTAQIMITMVIYMVAVIGIGVAFARRANKNSEAYFLGGRTLGPWVTAMSAESSICRDGCLWGFQVSHIGVELRMQHGRLSALLWEHISIGSSRQKGYAVIVRKLEMLLRCQNFFPIVSMKRAKLL